MSKVLVAEDSFALANLLKFVLVNAGFQPDIFHAGDKALEAGQSAVYDIIILDQQMPGLTGLEVAEALRKSGPNQATPICLCTAKTHELDIADAQERLLVTKLFHKPFSPKDLVGILRTIAEDATCS